MVYVRHRRYTNDPCLLLDAFLDAFLDTFLDASLDASLGAL